MQPIKGLHSTVYIAMFSFDDFVTIKNEMYQNILLSMFILRTIGNVLFFLKPECIAFMRCTRPEVAKSRSGETCFAANPNISGNPASLLNKVDIYRPGMPRIFSRGYRIFRDGVRLSKKYDLRPKGPS